MASKQASSANRKKPAARSSAPKASGKKAASKKKSAPVQSGSQLQAVLLFAFGMLLTFTALIPGGSLWFTLHQLLFGLFSWCGYLIGPLLLASSVLLSMEQDSGKPPFRLHLVPSLILIALICGAMHIASNRVIDGSFGAVLKYLYRDGMELYGGGAIGMLVGAPLIRLFEHTGASICIYLLIFIWVMLVTGSTVIGLFRTLFVKPARNVRDAYGNAMAERATAERAAESKKRPEKASRKKDIPENDEPEEEPSFFSDFLSILFPSRNEEEYDEEEDDEDDRRYRNRSSVQVSEDAAETAAKAVSQAAAAARPGETPSFSDESARSRLLNAVRGDIPAEQPQKTSGRNTVGRPPRPSVQKPAPAPETPQPFRTSAAADFSASERLFRSSGSADASARRQDSRSFFDFDQKLDTPPVSAPSAGDEETLAMVRTLLADEESDMDSSKRVIPDFLVSSPDSSVREAPAAARRGETQDSPANPGEEPAFEGEDEAVRYLQNLSRIHMVPPADRSSPTPVIGSASSATIPDFPISSYAFPDTLRPQEPAAPDNTAVFRDAQPTRSFTPVIPPSVAEIAPEPPRIAAQSPVTPPPEPETSFRQPENTDDDAEEPELIPDDSAAPVSSFDDMIRRAVEAQQTPPPSVIPEVPEPSDEPIDEVSDPETAPEPAEQPVQTELPLPAVQTAPEPAAPAEPPPYIFPPIELLSQPKVQISPDVSAELEENARLLIDTLKSFNVQASILNITRGPAVTRYEIQPGAGVKVSKIVNLADDLALNLAAPSIRMEAPIPGKRAIGIEVPNRKVSVVSIREVIDSPEFRNTPNILTVSLGKDIAGGIGLANIDKMPHLLIAGSTGSGKSVCINSFIVSLLYKARPDEVRLLMIDPKMVELSVYNGIPHLISPVVTDSKKAAGALCTMVAEMERRYALLAQHNVRNLKGYNELAKTTDGLAPMPSIVVVIDELADLMMTCPKDVEDYIMRLTQKARAAGIYLIIATQRPSVDVITGVIKANIPSRIAFAVSSQVDSRTILDTPGAEKLLGRGDMLFAPQGVSKPTRIQGCFVDDREVENVVEFIKQHSSANYSEELMNEIDQNAAKVGGKGAGSDSGSDEDDEDGEDELLNSAIELVVESGQASTSYLQRRLNVGYGRAARLIDTMERRGIVGPPNGSKARTVEISRDQWYEMKNRMS